MSQIKGKDTKPEVQFRKALWRVGLRYRVRSKLTGKPDVVFPGPKVAVFVDGCFWHRCQVHYVAPRTNAEFWEDKISTNVARDRAVDAELETAGWTVIRIWEHEIKEDLAACVSGVRRVVRYASSNAASQDYAQQRR